MLRARLRYSITSALTSSLLVLATPAVLAEAVSSKADATALLVADLAEDENVEDVEHSEPRRGSAQASAQAETICSNQLLSFFHSLSTYARAF